MADEEKAAGPSSAEDTSQRVTRRDFLVGAGAGVVVTGAAAAGIVSLMPPKTVEVPKEVIKEVVKEVPAAAPAQPPAAAPAAAPATKAATPAQPAAPIIEGAKNITLNVNGRDYQLSVEPQTTLIEVLRQKLGFTGPKLGCNGSMCSACAVLVDGVAQNSCSLLAIREAGKKIVTVEGLEKDGKLHPVQQAFWDQMGYQCGFCTPGQIIGAVELLSKVKNPTEEQIKRHMSSHMCKCSAYPNIVKAVQAAAKSV